MPFVFGFTDAARMQAGRGENKRRVAIGIEHHGRADQAPGIFGHELIFVEDESTYSNRHATYRRSRPFWRECVVWSQAIQWNAYSRFYERGRRR